MTVVPTKPDDQNKFMTGKKYVRVMLSKLDWVSHKSNSIRSMQFDFFF